jgi:hypothetical protein
MSAEGWTALAGVCGVLLALGAAIVGGWQLQEARRLRIEQAQPYIAVYADPSPAGSWVFDLVIKNFGRTPATNVRVQIQPDLKRAAYDDETVTLPAHRDVVDVASFHDAAKALQDIRTILKNAMPRGALNVLARDGDARDEQERARFEQRRRDLEAKQSGD